MHTYTIILFYPVFCSCKYLPMERHRIQVPARSISTSVPVVGELALEERGKAENGTRHLYIAEEIFFILDRACQHQLTTEQEDFEQRYCHNQRHNQSILIIPLSKKKSSTCSGKDSPKRSKSHPCVSGPKTPLKGPLERSLRKKEVSTVLHYKFRKQSKAHARVSVSRSSNIEVAKL